MICLSNNYPVIHWISQRAKYNLDRVLLVNLLCWVHSAGIILKILLDRQYRRHTGIFVWGVNELDLIPKYSRDQQMLLFCQLPHSSRHITIAGFPMLSERSGRKCLFLLWTCLAVLTRLKYLQLFCSCQTVQAISLCVYMCILHLYFFNASKLCQGLCSPLLACWIILPLNLV